MLFKHKEMSFHKDKVEDEFRNQMGIINYNLLKIFCFKSDEYHNRWEDEIAKYIRKVLFKCNNVKVRKGKLDAKVIKGILYDHFNCLTDDIDKLYKDKDYSDHERVTEHWAVADEYCNRFVVPMLTSMIDIIAPLFWYKNKDEEWDKAEQITSRLCRIMKEEKLNFAEVEG
jgi:hypothetical protein